MVDGSDTEMAGVLTSSLNPLPRCTREELLVPDLVTERETHNRAGGELKGSQNRGKTGSRGHASSGEDPGHAASPSGGPSYTQPSPGWAWRQSVGP